MQLIRDGCKIVQTHTLKLYSGFIQTLIHKNAVFIGYDTKYLSIKYI